MKWTITMRPAKTYAVYITVYRRAYTDRFAVIFWAAVAEVSHILPPPDHDSPRYERVSYPRKVQYLLSVSYSINSKLSFCIPVMVFEQPSVAGR